MRSANHSAPLQGLRLYEALLGLIQASGLAGGFDLFIRFFGHQSRLTHTVTHTAKCLKSGGEDMCSIRSAALCLFT